MDYTLHQLRVFLKVSETVSITKAAEELHLTQPAVSIQLKKLQDQFDVPLTEVIGRKLFITDFGKEIALAAERILAEVDALNYKTQTYRSNLAGRLRVSVASSGKYVMPYFLSGFMADNPAVDLVMDVTNKMQVLKSLENNTVDFALVSVVADHLKVNTMPLLENMIYLVGAHPEELQGRAKRASLSERPLIFREGGSATRSAMEKFIREKSLSNTKKIELTSNEAVKQAVLAGLGYSIMPLPGLKNELRNGDVSIIPYSGLPIKRVWTLVWLQAKKLSPVAHGFLEYLEENREQVIEQQFSWMDEYQ